MKNLQKSTILYSFIIGIIFLIAPKANAQFFQPQEYKKSIEIGIRFLPTISEFSMQTSNSDKTAGNVVIGYGGGFFVSSDIYDL
jgi:hypothetical protein